MTSEILLSRDAFRQAVFERSGGRCVVCHGPAADAHHIMERRLFPDGGYYLNNGAAVCAQHHLDCETTRISVEDIRLAAGIERKVLPPEYYDDQPYDKWGNPVLPNGRRMRGELFQDESVQKVLAMGGVLDQFTKYVKYPRTWHLPWSPSVGKDDRVLEDMSHFEGRRVVVTEKMDGENTTLYRDYIHARSIDGRTHPSRAWVKNFHAKMAHEIPDGWRICGENLYAEHSIHYDNLLSYFMGFSIWDDKNVCLSWKDTLEWFCLLPILPVTVLYDGIYDQKKIEGLSSLDWGFHEGYVMRVHDAFAYGEFPVSVGKFVRAGHIQTTKHWMHGQAMKVNQLQEL